MGGHHQGPGRRPKPTQSRYLLFSAALHPFPFPLVKGYQNYCFVSSLLSALALAVELTFSSKDGCVGLGWPIRALHSPGQSAGSGRDTGLNQSPIRGLLCRLDFGGWGAGGLGGWDAGGLGLEQPSGHLAGHVVGRACLSMELTRQSRRREMGSGGAAGTPGTNHVWTGTLLTFTRVNTCSFCSGHFGLDCLTFTTNGGLSNTPEKGAKYLQSEELC